MRDRPKSRALARARYEQQADSDTLARGAYCAMMEFFSAAKIPDDVARKSLEMCEAEIFDRLIEQSLSWVEDPARARTHPGSRGLMDPE